MPESYALSTWFFTRALGLVYLVAFLSLALQTRGLWGAQGILPIAGYLQQVEAAIGGSRFYRLPSLFWIDASDPVLVGAAWVGVACASAAAVGILPGWMLLFCYLIYLSFTCSGQDFMSFQWDALLLEVGFAALFLVPWNNWWCGWQAVEPHWTARWLVYLILFKLMFLSGVVKLQSQDPAWRDLTALSFHYWTQPLPNPISPFMHALPMWVHRVATAQTFLVELGLPFLIFPPITRVWAAAGMILLSLFIFLTGNYTFFNLLTIALCLLAVPDSFWQKAVDQLGLPLIAQKLPIAPPLTLVGVFAVLALISIFWCVRWTLPDEVEDLVLSWLSPVQAFHVSNSYGLFATMTKSRPEIVIEGSSDGVDWQEYEFRYKPGDLNRAPPVIAPLQPRLDWQMWFAALGSYRQNPWFVHLLERLFENSPEVTGLLQRNPFPDTAPKYLRARLYAYEFTTPLVIGQDSVWWTCTFLREYSPTFEH